MSGASEWKWTSFRFVFVRQSWKLLKGNEKFSPFSSTAKLCWSIIKEMLSLSSNSSLVRDSRNRSIFLLNSHKWHRLVRQNEKCFHVFFCLLFHKDEMGRKISAQYSKIVKSESEWEKDGDFYGNVNQYMSYVYDIKSIFIYPLTPSLPRSCNTATASHVWVCVMWQGMEISTAK